MKILVTGGAGFFGGRLIPQLIADHHDVLALVRSSEDAARMQALGATAIVGDLADPVGAALPPIEAVVHAAARFRFSGPRQAYLDTNVEGTRRLLADARRAGAKVFVEISSGSVIMDDAGSPVTDADERAPTYPDSFSGYIASKTQAEALVLAANAPGFRTIALRPTALWGPGDTFVRQLPDAISGGRFAWINKGDYPFATTHVDNAVEAVKLALDRGEGGRAYFVADREVMTFRAFIEMIAETQGESAAGLRSLSYPLAALLGAGMELAFSLAGRKDDPPMSRSMVRMIGRAFTVNDAAARQELRYLGRVGVAEGRQMYINARRGQDRAEKVD